MTDPITMSAWQHGVKGGAHMNECGAGRGHEGEGGVTAHQHMAQRGHQSRQAANERVTRENGCWEWNADVHYNYVLKNKT